jgi:hypothetical protein
MNLEGLKGPCVSRFQNNLVHCAVPSSDSFLNYPGIKTFFRTGSTGFTGLRIQPLFTLFLNSILPIQSSSIRAPHDLRPSTPQLLLVILAGWVNRQQPGVVEYLRAKNQILKEMLGKKRILLNDDQRRLAVQGKILGRKVLLLGRFRSSAYSTLQEIVVR